MSMTVGVIGIIVAIVVMNYLIYKGLNVVISAVITSFIIIFTNGLNLVDTWTSSMTAVGGVLSVLVPIVIFGSILGVLYTKSGATSAMADFLLLPFRNIEDINRRRFFCLLMFIIFRVVVSLAGIDAMAIMFTMLAVCAAMFADCDIPRKYVNCLMMVAGSAGALFPAVPNAGLIMYEQLVPGFDNSAGFIPRLLLMLLFTIAAVFIIFRSIKKDVANGIHFEMGPMPFPEAQEKRPNGLVSFVPILVVYVLYAFLNVAIWLAMICGVLAAMILFGAYIPKMEGKGRFGTVVETCNSGVFLVPVAILVNMLPGFVMQASPAYEYLISLLSGLPIPSAFGLLIIGTIITGVASSSTAVLMAGVITSTFIPGGMSPLAGVMIATYSGAILDTLPNSLGIIMQCEITGVTMKEAYPPIFKTTVALTAGLAVIATVLAMIGVFG